MKEGVGDCKFTLTSPIPFKRSNGTKGGRGYEREITNQGEEALGKKKELKEKKGTQKQLSFRREADGQVNGERRRAVEGNTKNKKKGGAGSGQGS